MRLDGEVTGRFSVLIVTTLETLLLSIQAGGAGQEGRMKLLAVDNSIGALVRLLVSRTRAADGERRQPDRHRTCCQPP